MDVFSIRYSTLVMYSLGSSAEDSDDGRTIEKRMDAQFIGTLTRIAIVLNEISNKNVSIVGTKSIVYFDEGIINNSFI